MNTEEKKQSRLTKKQKRNIIIVIIVLAVMVLADFVWSNTYIEVKKLSAHFDNLPEGFEDCKIVQISDFHNEWGKGYIDRLTEKVKDCEPDYIFVTGDSVDQIFPDVDRSLEFMKKLPDICPVYLVMGNHEYNLSQEEREQFVSGCESYGVNVLYNEHTTLTRNGSFDYAAFPIFFLPALARALLSTAFDSLLPCRIYCSLPYTLFTLCSFPSTSSEKKSVYKKNG